MRKSLTLLAIFLLLSLASSQAISITWDYTYDTNGFFTQDRREVMDRAASVFSNYIIDRDAIAPSGVNTWTWSFSDPSGSGTVSVIDPIVETGEIIIYLGSNYLSGSTLARGGNLGYSYAGYESWINLISSTNTADAYKPFGGAITFNLSTDWYTGEDISGILGSEYDMYSVALHELGHVFGIGLYNYIDAWDADVDTSLDLFTGVIATSIYGSDIPLTADFAHIAPGTTYNGDTFIMVPAISSGIRREFTDPEFGILQDLGYVVVPEPRLLFLFIAGILGVFLFVRKRKLSSI